MIGVGAMLNERFTLDKELGQGGMGTVYRAADQLLGRNVAIKLLKDSGAEEEAEKIRLEAQILARLVHDRIVRLYDFGESQGTCFLVMEEVDGPSFSNRWRDLLLGDRLRICGQVAEALDYAHAPGGDPPRRQTGQRPAHVERRGEALRLRPVARHRRPEGPERDDPGHPSIHEPGAGPGQVARPSHRPVFRGRDGLRMRDRRRPVRRPYDVRDAASTSTPRPRPRGSRTPRSGRRWRALILSLLEKHPSRRPASANLVALALFEEAERARRLDRINPGLRRADPRSPVDPPPSRTLTVGDRKPSRPRRTGRAG